MSAARTVTVSLLLSGLVLVPLVSGAQERLVRPGGIVRWQAAGTTSCSAMEQSWAPIGDTCWYPIDLLLPEAQVSLQRVRNGRSERTSITIAPYPYPTQELTVDSSKVHLSQEDLARHRAETQRVIALWSLTTPARFSLPLQSPLPQAPAPSGFGNRRIFNGEPRNPHNGVDFSAARGTPVLASANGTVALAEEHFFAGNSVFIDHGGGLITMYMHLDQITVKQGDEVTRGQAIGKVGSTGRATGPHLHYGVRWHGARVDPGLLLGPISEVPAIN
jgi:murein DD-endopeptidase MepM/ murein hydrolase activator NlpD